MFFNLQKVLADDGEINSETREKTTATIKIKMIPSSFSFREISHALRERFIWITAKHDQVFTRRLKVIHF